MDKMRAIQYFNRAVETGSFTSAARSLDVSTPAVTQLVAALERSLGAVLLHRTTRGLSLTADGTRYHETSCKVAADLYAAEQLLAPRGAKPRGTLTVGMVPVLGSNWLMPRVAKFLARYPEVKLIARRMRTYQDFDGRNIDVAVLVGLPPERDLIVRQIAHTRNIVCASPEYWMRQGRPRQPEELVDHHCLVLQTIGGSDQTRWMFERNGERRVVDVKTRLISDDRNWLDTAAIAGAGVVRFSDLTLIPYLSAGSLVPVLTDWKTLGSPAIYAAYPSRQRNSKLVRVFVDFMAEVAGELEKERPPGPASLVPRGSKPERDGGAHGRASTVVARGKKADA